MFKKIKTGSGLINQSINVLQKHPSFSIPLFICWFLYAPIVIYLKYFFPWDQFEFYAQAAAFLLALMVFSTILGISCLALLELIQQIETGQKPSLKQAYKDVFSQDIILALPILFIWALLWFLITILEVIFSKRKSNSDSNEKYTAENAAKTLAGLDGDFSLSGAFFDSLKKGIRMVVFLILPAIAWEEDMPVSAMNKGLKILRSHLSTFASGFILTELASLIVFLPAAILFYISAKAKVSISDEVWFGVIIYCSFTWTFTIFLEQMFAAELYLWHMKWKTACNEAYKNGVKAPRFENVQRPSILDDIPELTKIIDLQKVAG